MLVSGASSGIGAACTARLAAAGYDVVAGMREPCDRPAESSGASVHVVPLDVTCAASVTRAVEFATTLAGDRGLAALVNCAGISVMGPIETLPIDRWRRQYEVNVFGTVALTQACLPALRRARGRVVIVSSIAGRVSTAYSGAYSSSKYALEAIADALRLEVARWHVGVSLIEPGAIATPIWLKVDASWAEAATGAAPDVSALYRSAIAGMRAEVARYGARAIGVEPVVRAIEHALTSRRPRIRYLVGREARLRATVRAWLPDRLHDALMRRVMHLP